MTSQEITEINADRLQQWSEKLRAENATGILLIGIGHGDASGKVCVFPTEALRAENVCALLRVIIKLIARDN